MARPSKTEQEMGYLKDFWEEVRTMEADYHGMWSMSVRPSNRPGVMIHVMSLTPLMMNELNPMGVETIEFSYPNAEQSTYSGFLWRKAIALGRQVAGSAETARNRRKNGG
jgi:hypothetical protein